MSVPDVSVVIAAWKAETFISRAVTSALGSVDVSVEVVIVDDASPDGTLALARSLAASDSRVVVDQLPANAGPSAARNRAIALAKGRYLAVLDADDAMAPQRLARLVRRADAIQADIIADNMMEVDETGRRLGAQHFLTSPRFSHDGPVSLLDWIEFNQPMKGGDCLGYLKPLVRRERFAKLNAGYDVSLRNSEDYYLVADLLARGLRMFYIAEPGYLYTRSSQSTSHRLKPQQTIAWLSAEERFMRAHGPRMSPAERSACTHRMRALRNVHQLIAATDALKTRRFGRAFSLLASDLQATGYTLGMLLRIGFGKLVRRKLV